MYGRLRDGAGAAEHDGTSPWSSRGASRPTSRRRCSWSTPRAASLTSTSRPSASSDSRRQGAGSATADLARAVKPVDEEGRAASAENLRWPPHSGRGSPSRGGFGSMLADGQRRSLRSSASLCSLRRIGSSADRRLLGSPGRGTSVGHEGSGAGGAAGPSPRPARRRSATEATRRASRCGATTR